MTARALLASLLVVAGTLGTTPGTAAATRQVLVTSTRIHLRDLMPDAETAAADVDLGPSPAAGGSRVVTRADIVAALDAKQVSAPPALPDAVRVLRSAKHLTTTEMNAIVRTAVDAKMLGRGVSLTAVRTDRPVDIADGWTRVDVDVPRAPKKAGPFATMAIASFFVGDEVIARFPVRIELAVSAEGATYDAPRGASLTLIVRRTLVEVRAPAFAAADADVGDAFPVQLRPSGRVVRARLVSKDEAVALENGQ
jgi:hypothetical protein